MPNRMRELRTEVGLSQEDLARKSGLSVFTISKTERGREPSLSTARTIAEALGVGVSDIWPDLAEKAS